MSENNAPPMAVPPQPPMAHQPPVGQGQRKGFAITALVLGIIAILGSWIPFLSIGSALIGLVGLVFGIIAVVKAFKGTAGGKVMAIIGTVLSGLAIIFAIVSTAAGVAAVDSSLEDLEGDITAATPAEPTEQPVVNESDAPAEVAEDEPAEPTVGTLASPAALGDGTVWTIEALDDEWQITLDAVEVVEGYTGEVVVLTGTATPTVIGDGDVSSWVSFPSIGWMAEGATVDDTFDIVQGDYPGDEYRHVIDLEATAGTTMKFYSSVGLPDGVVPELVTLDTLFGSDTIYVSTGL